MTSCRCARVQEATELSALFLRVETVFAGGDVPAIAEMLATMRRSLLLVGDVPEFKGGMERLEVRSRVRRPSTSRVTLADFWTCSLACAVMAPKMNLVA